MMFKKKIVLHNQIEKKSHIGLNRIAPLTMLFTSGGNE